MFGALYLTPAASSLVAGLFLDDVAEAVEKESYPNDPLGRPQPLGRSILASIRFFGVVLAVNLAALFLLLVPGVNIIIFYVANAYLLSREYFELAAMRYRTPKRRGRCGRRMRFRSSSPACSSCRCCSSPSSTSSRRSTARR